MIYNELFETTRLYFDSANGSACIQALKSGRLIVAVPYQVLFSCTVGYVLTLYIPTSSISIVEYFPNTITVDSCILHDVW
jgi:hypothetical protein